MKKAPTKEITASVTSKAKLTIHGQVHELTMEELNSLYDQIHKALGKPSPFAEIERFRRENDRARLHPMPPPMQFAPPGRRDDVGWPIETAPYCDPSTHPICITV